MRTNRVHEWLCRTCRTALPASVATTAAVAICGHIEDHNAAAPLNATSHILWGEEAAHREDLSVDHTAAGIALNTAAVASWSAAYELAFGRVARERPVSVALLSGMAIAGLAYVTDYYVVPKRLTPGFEKRLSPVSMLIVYATLAATLPLMSILERDEDGNNNR